MLRLNLGCGSNRIDDCINIDVEKGVNPDVVCDFLHDRLPYQDGEVDEVFLFHTIEHIQKKHHMRLFDEVYRVLKLDGKFYLSYPEFTKCAQNWIENKNGKREFWEATIFGRQAYASDYHVCIMDPHELKLKLWASGFKDVQHTPEYPETYNTVTVCRRGVNKYMSYEELIATSRLELQKL